MKKFEDSCHHDDNGDIDDEDENREDEKESNIETNDLDEYIEVIEVGKPYKVESDVNSENNDNHLGSQNGNEVGDSKRHEATKLNFVFQQESSEQQ
ncbi:hypothetical protein L2E82_40168 [Cichorium intybus]|uniref:Uncharacterized protein n=1 Tax=Cichorium intybus TaxID=13427 RepID=A0ACB9ALZ8_CICIN|nr:hypothetical protein L2E82_40168 [Cichorium intybus]